MPASRFSRRFDLRVALLVAAIATLLPCGSATAESFGSGLDLATAVPWSGQSAVGFHLSDPSVFLPNGGPPRSRLFPVDAPSAFGPMSPVPSEARWELDLAPVSGVPPRPDRSTIVAGGFTALFLGLEYAAFWSNETLNGKFQVANEHWFGQTTYAGGADKASHVLGGYIAGRVLDWGLQWSGSPPAKSQFLSATMIAVTGTLIEVGDAYHGFGFSWQDALLTASGGVAGSVLAATKLDDTITMRFGMVGIDSPDEAEFAVYEPNHYSGEIYTIDLRMAGLLPRLGKPPGFARFLLASMTYGSKGYQWVDERYRQRRVGFEIGIDTYEVGLALGLKPDTWYGAPILGFLRYFRLPFTGLGFQYELNSGRWMGPNSFYSYDQ
jgi:hypothetical protein